MKNLSIELGKKIRKLRKEKGFSQEKFAEEVGIHRTYMGCIERGEKMITISTAKKITDALGISLSDLFEKF